MSKVKFKFSRKDHKEYVVDAKSLDGNLVALSVEGEAIEKWAEVTWSGHAQSCFFLGLHIREKAAARLAENPCQKCTNYCCYCIW